ncbi:type III secretion system ATPase SctN [Proteus mirabilis]|uniref:type III secretion system ATPase SctN n=2 Tax=Proteus mirabilis TaxID=584 RepID=UPI0023495957|nr:type III secretion system ATPase SctN [Proteus mirabilis]MDC5907436.1 type III secretion system ATPase SctN [Proteus mirabilis]MDC5932067.1 type III secretion system ATPase SctN [Proteus mirabilis]MDC5941317.1 type III secretion system ATPase SctN [Proteus mirabilis]MDC5942628.1 type III secretion system ATPase SctN [Proteus mirabilis]MDC5957254.1 type III secretion system ATPase SctN [Proteus mirabilis]
MDYQMHTPFKWAAHPTRIQSGIIEAPLKNVAIGEICLIRTSVGQKKTIGRAQVIGFYHDNAILSLMGSDRGFSLNVIIEPTGMPFSVKLGEGILGSMIDAHGQTLTRFSPVVSSSWHSYLVQRMAPEFSRRRGINTIFASGVRAIDSVLTCGKGQRMGIFATAGCGKTVLMNMIINSAEADVFVVALVGERGREVTEFVEELKDSQRSLKTVVVCSTSDQPAVDRCNAALVATTVAEYFRDRGQHVVLFLDSITRYSRALRDVALAAGELPARRGYPASVFEQLPIILERPGNTCDGAITAFYTVLLENEDESDAIGDEVRSILDGHIYLTRKLAAKGHYPAIDVLRSTSRLFQQITDEKHQTAARQFRELLARQDELKFLLEMGEYRRGENTQNDIAIDKQPAMEAFLRQSWQQNSSFEQSLQGLYELVG